MRKMDLCSVCKRMRIGEVQEKGEVVCDACLTRRVPVNPDMELHFGKEEVMEW